MLFLYAEGKDGKIAGPIRGQTRLMKMVFLFEKEIYRKFKSDSEIGDTEFPNFKPYDYGPFSVQIYADLEFLVNHGFIRVRAEETNLNLEVEEIKEFEYWVAAGTRDDDLDPNYVGRQFELTDLGQRFVEEILWSRLSENQKELLRKFKIRCTTTSLRNLLKYVYAKYENMTKKSKIKVEILQ